MKQENPAPLKKDIIKSISLIFNFLLLAGIAYLFLEDNSHAASEEKSIKFDSCSNVCLDYSGTNFQEMDVDMLHAMRSKYDTTTTIYSKRLQRRYVQVSPGNIVDDSRSIWFSLDSLKKFIWEVETGVCKNNCSARDQKLNLGLRLYFARYQQSGPGSPQTLNFNQPYENMHTIFMVPTYEINGANTDFDPRKFTQSTCSYNTLEGGQKVLVFMPIPTKGSTVAKNHGTLCPTICNGSAF